VPAAVRSLAPSPSVCDDWVGYRRRRPTPGAEAFADIFTGEERPPGIPTPSLPCLLCETEFPISNINLFGYLTLVPLLGQSLLKTHSMASATGGSSSEMAVDHPTGPGAAVEKPRFDALMPSEMSGGRPQFRKVPVPQHRFAPLKRCWMEIYTPVYEHMKIDIRMNLKVRG